MKFIKRKLSTKYRQYKLKYEILKFDLYRVFYDYFSLSFKIKLANKWLKKYPEQAHFTYQSIQEWFEYYVQRPASIIEIGGWRGDLAQKSLVDYPFIKLWHNYDFIEYNYYQNCYDKRYNLISLKHYIWNISTDYSYNALIATHVIEHLKWNEFIQLVHWIPSSVKTVLFEAPIVQSSENFKWKGDHSSHILEKGWQQVKNEMGKVGFLVEFTDKDTVIFKR